MWMWSWEGIAAALALLLTPCDQPGFPARYDAMIQSAVEHHWPVEARPYWCRYKSQLVEESGLRPGAVSPVGARGLAQFMPRTWADVRRSARLDPTATPHDARAAIRAGAWYTGWIRSRWSEPRGERCRQDLVAASYNSGLGHQVRAQRLARAAGRPGLCFDDLRRHLPEVTGRHAAETCRYVDRVRARAQGQPPPRRSPCRGSR